MSDDTCRFRGWRLFFVATWALLVACPGTSGRIEHRPPDHSDPSDHQAPGRAVSPPPEPGAQTWRYPRPVGSDTAFPYLPGEDRAVSRSVGDVTRGFLVAGKRVSQPHPNLLFLKTQFGRELVYTSDPMRRVLRETSEFVAERHPSKIVQLGNLGHRTGGDIPYSVSHNSGRDADLAFLLETPDGKPYIPEDLVSVDASGEATVTDEGEERTLVFDTAGNWAVVEGLIRASGDDLQHIFVSHPLKTRLLTYARRHDVPADIRSRAQRVLGQPWGSLPHDDHFHVRLYCSSVDVASGCRERGTKHPWYDPHRKARGETIRRARRLVRDGDRSEKVRASAIRRLALMDTKADSLFRTAVDDESPRVRAAAARALADTGEGGDVLAARLQIEHHPQVLIELVDGLGRLSSERAVSALIDELKTPRLVELPGQFDVDLRTYVADSLIQTGVRDAVPALIATLDSHVDGVSQASRRALRFLTNHRLRPGAASDDWKTWWEDNRDASRDTWLSAGFQEAGYDVPERLRDGIWELCRAIEDEDYLSYNAQRILMGISGKSPPSLSWPKFDAHVYWSRWFDKNRDRFGLKPAPRDVSTEMN